MSAPTFCGQINPAKGQTFIKKQLWSLWYVWMREDFCIIIFSLSFNATSVMASRDACETKSVSLQISLLATVPCKETPRCLRWNTRPPPCSRMEARDSGTRWQVHYQEKGPKGHRNETDGDVDRILVDRIVDWVVFFLPFIPYPNLHSTLEVVIREWLFRLNHHIPTSASEGPHVLQPK